MVTTAKTAHVMVNGSETGLGTGYRVWFYYPFTSATAELGLRRPALNNIIEQAPLTISRRMRSRGLVRFHYPPRRRAVGLQFNFLFPTMAAEAKTFFETVLSGAMRYVDHNETTWKAYLMPDTLTFTESTRSGTENLALRLEIEAV